MGGEMKQPGPRPSWPGLLGDKTAAGAIRWRVRVEGQPNRKVRIPVGPGDRGFENAYFAARAGEDVPKPAVHSGPKKGTLDELCQRFLEWMEGEVAAGSLSPLTLSSRRTGLTQACDVRDPDGDRLGDLDSDLPEEAFTHILDAFPGRKGAADTCLKALRAAYRWGEARGDPKSGAVFRVKSGYRQGEGATPWTQDDVQRFMDRHPAGSMARLWFTLAYATGGRIGDAPHLGPGNIQTHDGERYLEWQPRKKGSALVSVPIHAMLETELEQHPPRPTFFITDHGKPFSSPASLGNRVRKWIVQAGLVDADGKAARSQHGVRKGVAGLMASHGATEFELMATFGWTEAKTAAVYTRKYNRRRTAEAAAKRRAEAETGPRPENRGPQSEPST